MAYFTFLLNFFLKFFGLPEIFFLVFRQYTKTFPENKIFGKKINNEAQRKILFDPSLKELRNYFLDNFWENFM